MNTNIPVFHAYWSNIMLNKDFLNTDYQYFIIKEVARVAVKMSFLAL